MVGDMISQNYLATHRDKQKVRGGRGGRERIKGLHIFRIGDVLQCKVIFKLKKAKNAS